MNRLASRIINKLLISMAFLMLSILLAVYINNTGAFWQFISWMPKSLSERLFAFLNMILLSVRPLEIYAQESQLYFFAAWVFSCTAVAVIYLSYIAVKRVLRVRNS
jgi:hypothetical protein